MPSHKLHLYAQWSLAEPRDWERVDLADDEAWLRLAKRPEPTGAEAIDAQAGYISGLCFQGIIFGGMDHYAVESTTCQGEHAVRITEWNDDPEDFSPDEYQAVAWTLLAPAHDERVARVNTRQTLDIYAAPSARKHWRTREPIQCSGGLATIHDWNVFSPPLAEATRHGIWLPDELDAAHDAARSLHGWEEWA